MRIPQEANYKIIYSLNEHPDLGYIIEPYIVQLTSSGSLSLTYQKVHILNAEYFDKALDEKDYQLLEQLEQITPERIAQKFAPGQKLRPREFFEKKLNDKLLNSFVRPFIDGVLTSCFMLMHDRNFYLFGQKNPAQRRIQMTEEPSTILFHFLKNENGMKYFPVIRYKGQRVYFSQNDSRIILHDPCWLLAENKLLYFNDELDGKKLEPFLHKKFILVPLASVGTYLQKIAVPLFEKHNLFCEGIRVETERHKASPHIRLEEIIDGKPGFVLSFHYDDQRFHFHSSKKVSVALHEEEGEFILRRIKRSNTWEEQKKDKLLELGLVQDSPSVFRLPPGKTDNITYYLEWLQKNLTELEAAHFGIEQGGKGKVYFLGKADLQIELKENTDWFDLEAIVRFGEYEIPYIQLRKYITKGIREFELPNGEIAVIPEEWFEQMGGVIELSKSRDQLRLEKHQLGHLQHLMNSRTIKTKLDRLKDFDQIEEQSLPQGFKGTLRPYQKAGYDWFMFLQQFGFGGCLADDMGLGKTVQTLALLANEKERSVHLQEVVTNEINVAETPAALPTPFNSPQLDIFKGAGNEETRRSAVVRSINERKVSLLIVPASLIYNWWYEAEKFAPALKKYIHLGIGRANDAALFEKYDLIISTYGTVRNDIELFRQKVFHYAILDESQTIKNPHSQTFKAIKDLKATNRLTLTGTPIENSITDLWSQFHFLNPGLLGSYKSFVKNYADPIEKQKNHEKAEKLQAIVKPFLMRRTKEQVAKDLPEKIEQLVYCDMTEEQEKLYEAKKSEYRNHILDQIASQGLENSKLFVIKGLTELRLIANHPKLNQSKYTGDSGKFEELIERIDTVVEQGHKVLVFSQFVKQLRNIAGKLMEMHHDFCYIDGSTSPSDRSMEVERFQEDEWVRIFLISLKAGGTGLNLTEADYVFLADPWWNPAVEQQAIDRSHRIGQTKTVFSYKFITRNSIEEKIHMLQQKKKFWSDSIITTEEGFIKHLDENDIEQLLI